MVGYALIPKTLARFGFTGKTVPPKGFVKRFHNTVLPMLPTVSVAPRTATVLGVKKTLKGCFARRNMLSAVSVRWDPGFVVPDFAS
jgi:hypothetical protein